MYTKIASTLCAFGLVLGGASIALADDGSSIKGNITVHLKGQVLQPAHGWSNSGTTSDTHEWRASSTSVSARFLGEKRGLIMSIGHVISTLASERGHHENGNAEMVPLATVLSGSITSIDTASFSLQVPARGNHATSTAIITTDASTTYERDQSGEGSGAAALSDLSLGSTVTVRGILTATSTMTVAARRIEIGTSTPRGGMNAEAHAFIAAKIASSTVHIEFKNLLQSFLGTLGGLFRF